MNSIATNSAVDSIEAIVHLRRGLVNLGYRVVPVDGKRARGDNWPSSKWSADQMDGLARNNPDATNTGILTGEVVALDIDTPDQETAEAIIAMAADLPKFSAAPYRIGKAPKRCYLFRTNSPRPKSTTGAYVINGNKCQVEVMGVGQQVVAYGVHPDTQRGYEWFNGSPAEIPAADLPEIDHADVDALLARADAYFAEHGALIKRASAARGVRSTVVESDHPWAMLNQRAFANLPGWVPQLGLDDLKAYQNGYHSVASFRPTNSATAKKRGRALNIQPEGICDHADNNAGYSPIDLVAVCLGLQDYEAVDWLEERVGDPDSTPHVDTGRLLRKVAQRELPACAPSHANDNSANKVRVKTPAEERDILRDFNLNQLLPEERGRLVCEDGDVTADGEVQSNWRLVGVEIDGHAGDVFIDAKSGEPKFAPNGVDLAPVETIIPDAPMPIQNPADWMDRKLPARVWYVDGYIPAKTVTLLSGDGAAGKSLLLAQLLAASAMRVETLGLSPMHGRALLLAAEDDEDELHRRFDGIARAHGRSLSDLGDLRVASLADVDAVLGSPDKNGNVIPTSLWRRTLKVIEKFKPTVVGLDTLADLSAVDEIKRNQARAFIAMVRKAAIKYDLTAILLAHPSLSGLKEGTGTSGSTGWNNSVRSRLYLTVDGNSSGRTMQHMKSNYGPLQEDIHLIYDEGIFIRRDPSKPGIAAGILANHSDKRVLDLFEKFRVQRIDVSPSKTSPTYAGKEIMRHPDGKGLKKDDVERSIRRLIDEGKLLIVDEGTAARPRKRLKLAAFVYGEVAPAY